MTRSNMISLSTFVLGFVIAIWPGYATSEPRIHTVLPKDAITAILSPEFVDVQAAKIEAETAMIGVVLQDEAHAYSAILLNTHEIVNDVVGGVKVATTW